MNLLCGFYPRLAGLIYYTTKEIPFHRLTFTEPRDYRVVFFIQKTLSESRESVFLFLIIVLLTSITIVCFPTWNFLFF